MGNGRSSNLKHPWRERICFKESVVHVPRRSSILISVFRLQFYAVNLFYAVIISVNEIILFVSIIIDVISNMAYLGPGFDGLSDFVSLAVDPKVHPGEVAIAGITGDHAAELSPDLLRNCAGIAAVEVMRTLGVRSVGLSLTLEKGLQLGSGLGSNAESAAAAAVAVNEIFGGKLGFKELVAAGLKSEEKVSGYHADNIAHGRVRPDPELRALGAEEAELSSPSEPGVRGSDEGDEGGAAGRDSHGPPRVE